MRLSRVYSSQLLCFIGLVKLKRRLKLLYSLLVPRNDIFNNRLNCTSTVYEIKRKLNCVDRGFFVDPAPKGAGILYTC